MSMSAAAAGTTKPLVVVTGGARGIGRATCLLLASRGYDVAVNYQSNAEGAQSVVTDIESAGGHARAFQADVSEESQVTQLFDDVVKAFGRAPNGLVNNAGIMEPWLNDIATIEFDTLDRDIRTNLYGPWFCTREFVKRASTASGGKGGSIVNVSSTSAASSQPLAYGISKAAQEAMANGLSKTLPPNHGIRINTVVPGLTDTGLASEENIAILAKIIPLRRAAEPDEIAKGIAVLLSDESSYASGAFLKISGGL
jgi:NAD(P)-dependent dehydrogenase (short-subunit alcohol dehydrogenase family)